MQKAAATKNGPNGMYSSVDFNIIILTNIIAIEITVAKKNANNEISAILENPKYRPNAPINLTSPKSHSFFSSCQTSKQSN